MFLAQLDAKLANVASKVARMCPRLDRQDLRQEMLIFLWRNWEKLAGEKESYILQAGFQHVRNYIRLGKSIDAPLRKNVELVNLDEIVGKSVEDGDGRKGRFIRRDSLLNWPQDHLERKLLLADLREKLKSNEQNLFDLYLEGYTQSEIVTMLQINQTTVSRTWMQLVRKLKNFVISERLYEIPLNSPFCKGGTRGIRKQASDRPREVEMSTRQRGSFQVRQGAQHLGREGWN